MSSVLTVNSILLMLVGLVNIVLAIKKEKIPLKLQVLFYFLVFINVLLNILTIVIKSI